MINKNLSLLLCIIFSFTKYGIAQTFQLNDVPQAFRNIHKQPAVFYFTKKQVKVPIGGHLQGIQGWSKDSEEQVVITSSSGKNSFYIAAQLDSVRSLGRVTAIRKLFPPPYRHAGGCQLADNKLIVGVEDNLAKNKSKIIAVILQDSLSATDEIIISRQGSYKRSTAGASGILKGKDGKYLVIVGDWDSRHFDFYLSHDTSCNSFDSVFTCNKPENQKWGSYQSFNLLADTSGNLFAIGFCKDTKGNRADLFRLQSYRLQWIGERYFNCTKGTGFRFGAGLRVVNGNKLLIYTCARKLKKINCVNIFGW